MPLSYKDNAHGGTHRHKVTHMSSHTGALLHFCEFSVDLAPARMSISMRAPEIE